MNINAALGMASERPLQGPSREWLLKMADIEGKYGSPSAISPELLASMQSDECSTCGIGSRFPSGVSKAQELAKEIADELFTNGMGEVADRLVCEVSGKDRGGYCREAVERIIAAKVEPMAELERLRRQVAFVKKESLLAIRDIRGKHVETRCGLCKNVWHPLGEPYHDADCPHGEVAT
jgi:hypothetical protein